MADCKAKGKVVLSLGLSSKPAKKKNPAAASVLNAAAKEDGPGDDDVKIDFIKSSADIGAPAKSDGPELIIPLTQNPWTGTAAAADAPPKTSDAGAKGVAKGGAKGGAKGVAKGVAKGEAKAGAGADAEAVAALLGEARGSEGGALPGPSGPAMVIAPVGGGASTTAGKKQPILQAAMIPGLEECKDDAEKFKFDMEKRAENIDEKSECYASVPISKFGEGMLRGMGWDGTRSDEAAEKAKARPSRLGLGAKAAPPPPPGKGKGGGGGKGWIKKPGQAEDKQAGANAEGWKAEAARKLENQSLSKGAVVWLKDPRFIRKGDVTRARVLGAAPGLNKVELVLEGPGPGEVVVVARHDAVLVAKDELACRPFKDAQAPRGSEGGRAECQGAASEDRKRNRDRGGDRGRDEGSGDQGRDRSPKRAKKSSKSQRAHKQQEWAFPGLRVRVLQPGQAHHRGKGEVVAFSGEEKKGGGVTVRMDGEGKRGGTLVAGLGNDDLETLVPSVGDKVRVVRGELRKSKGVILKKDRDREEVKLEIDGKEEWFSFNDVTARA